MNPDEVAALTPPASTAAPAPVERNNPLNLRPLPGGQWPGQTDVNGGFAVFGDPQSGWNAADQNLQAKVTKHGLKTIAGIIGDPTYGWAPAADNNDPASYAAKVAAGLGVKPTDDISQRLVTDADFRHQMLGQMAGVETGKPQTFGGAPAPDGTAFGLTPDEVQLLETAPGPKVAGADQPGPTNQFTFGPKMGPVSKAAIPTYQRILQDRSGGDPNVMRNAEVGSAQLPFWVPAGNPVPTTPSMHWVDVNGLEHVNPGGPLEKAASGIAGALEGIGADTAASAARLGLGQGDPTLNAFAQTQGAPSALANYQGANQGFQQQQRNYALAHYGDPYAQTGRFLGQMVPSTLAALAVPEMKAPEEVASALGKVVTPLLERGATASARGAASTATQVGANPDVPVTTQLATGAVAGPVAEAAGSTVQGVKALVRRTGVNPDTIPPETMKLADVAINQYGIPIRASQIGGTVNRNLANQDSNLIATQYRGNALDQVAKWNRQLIKQTGADDFASPTPAAMSAARERTGAIYDDLASRYSITDPSSLVNRLQEIYKSAKGAVPAGDLTPLAQQIENVQSVVQDGRISGAGYKGLTDTGSSLDVLAGSEGPVSAYARQFRDAIDSAMRENMSLADQARLDQANSQWKALKAIEPLAAKAGPTGIISPPALIGRLSSNRFYKGSLPYTPTGDDPMTDLARIGGLIKEPPQSGTTPRLMETLKRQVAPAIAGGVIGGQAALGHPALEALANPQVGLQLAAGAGAAKGTQLALDALRNVRFGPGAAAALVGAKAPRSELGNALSGVRKSVEVPLSALAGLRFQYPGAAPVGANVQ